MTKKDGLLKQTLAEIVIENYNAADLFDQYELDFYCKGMDTLEEACNNKNLDYDQIADELSGLPRSGRTRSEDVRNWPIDFLADFIENTHHEYVRAENEKLSRFAAFISKNHSEYYPEFNSVYEQFLFLIQEVDRHMNEEEERIFPLIKELASEVVESGNPDKETVSVFRYEIEKLRNEHETAIGMLRELKETSNSFNPPDDASEEVKTFYHDLFEFERDMHRHIHLESNVLFRKAEELANARPA